jgi:hypothetical protein
LSRLLKFLHTMGAIGLMGATACLIVLMRFAPPRASLAEYAAMRGAMADIAQWIYLPSLGLTLIAGLLAIAANHAYQNAGWAWVKLATGVLMVEGSMISVLGPIEDEAKRSANALARHLDGAAAAAPDGAGQNLLWALLAVMTANVVLGVWRPRLVRFSD